MNPLRWIRWKILVVLTLLFGLIYALGLEPVARTQINSAGESAASTRWRVANLGLGFLSGDFSVGDLLVASAASTSEPGVDPKQRVISADLARFDLDMGELSRRRFVIEEMVLRRPQVKVRRAEAGPAEPGTDAPPKSAEDWVETAKDWYEKLGGLREKLPELWKKDKEAPPQAENLYAKRVLYPFAERPGIVVRRIASEDLSIDIGESAGTGKAIAEVTSAAIELTGLSSRPDLHAEPIQLSLKGLLAGEALGLAAMVDFRKPDAEWTLNLVTGPLPATLLAELLGDSLPVNLSQGTVRVNADLRLGAGGALALAPKLSFQGVALGKKDGSAKVAGVDATQFVSAFNEASKFLGDRPLDLVDLKIGGTLDSPSFEWGDTITKLVTEGGKAFAQAQIARAEALVSEEAAKLQSKLDAETAKVQGKLDAELGKGREKLDEALGKELGTGLDKVLGEGAGKGALDAVEGLVPKGLVPNTGDPKAADGGKTGGAVEDAAKSGLDALRKGTSGLFGGGKKDEKKD